MEKMAILASCALALAGCVPTARLKQDSGAPTLSSEIGVKSPAGPKREKLPAVEASSPSRALDAGDPTGGRLTLVEMHHRAMRENEALKSEIRAREQQLAEAESAREAFRARSVELDGEVQKMKRGFEEMSKENLDIKAQLVEAAIRVAELEKQLLQTKIDALKSRKPAAKPPEAKPKPEAEKKQAESHESGEGAKKDKEHH